MRPRSPSAAAPRSAVGDRVKGDVAVRMAMEAWRSLDLDAAEMEGLARAEWVRVDPVARAALDAGREHRGGALEVGGQRDLEIHGISGDGVDADCTGDEARGLIGEPIRAVGREALEGLSEEPGPRALWRLRSDEPVPVDDLAEARFLGAGAADGVRHGDRPEPPPHGRRPPRPRRSRAPGSRADERHHGPARPDPDRRRRHRAGPGRRARRQPRHPDARRPGRPRPRPRADTVGLPRAPPPRASRARSARPRGTRRRPRAHGPAAAAAQQREPLVDAVHPGGRARRDDDCVGMDPG